MRPISLRLSLAALTLVGTLACHRGGAGPEAEPVTDANIIAIILAANNTDLSYARLVPTRARATEVISFATRMTQDHTFLNTAANGIAAKHGIVAEDNVVSLDFRDKSAARRDILRELTGAKFDSAYAENEVQYHTELLSAIDAVLIPTARNAELKAFVVSLKPAVTAHLNHATQMRTALSGRK